MNAQRISSEFGLLHRKTVLKEFGSGCLLLLFFSISAFADTHYVSLSGSHTAPFTEWMTAATNIQAAIDVTEAGDTVLVTNGLYAVGGTFVADVTNRVAITNPVTVQSVNGSGATTIQGQGPMGAAAVRCVYVADGAKLIGFTLTNGFTHVFAGSSGSGGGIYCDSTAGLISNCTLTGNLAGWNGGGAYGGALYNCVITGNSASCGGGASDGTLYNCVIIGNSAHGFRAMGGGGTYNGTLYNCILTGNTSTYGGGTCGGTLYNCTLTGNSASYSGGGASYGTLYNSIVYYNTASSDSNWLSCTLYYSCTTPDPEGTGNITGEPLFVNTNGDYHLTSGSPCIDAGNNASGGGSDLDGRSRTVGSAVDMGCYEASQVHSGNSKVHYVSPLGNNVWPYTNWITAATIVQHAVDAANAGDMVLVTNGVYAVGGAFAAGQTNRVAITNAVTVRSMNGPEVTIIQGQELWGAAAVRCAYVADGAALVGFTLTNGFTRVSGSGGGIYCDSAAGIISNCTLTRNRALANGGGAYNGTLYNCVIIGNSASGMRSSSGGGAFNCTLYNCTLIDNSASEGGGTYGGALYNCILTENSAHYSDGGGASYGTLYNCTLTSNSAPSGGGVSYGTLYNCTLTGNSASKYGGGVSTSTLYNCIAYYNTAPRDPNYSGSALNYCCTLPMPSSGTSNFTSAPGLVGLTNPHLTQGSPCINAGSNAYVFTATDLDGEARINGATVDVGCDEFWANSCTGTFRVAILTPAGTNALTGVPLSFQADIGGRPLTYVWRFGDGTSTTNEIVVSHAYERSGEYSVVLEAANLSGSVSATVTVRIVSMAGATRYVTTNGNDAADGTSWATAKATIQGGIAAATTPGGLVLVSNGVYALGGAFAAGMTNRVVITNALTVQSVNGPGATTIQGQGPMGAAAIRCAYVADGAKLVGFTLTNGFTQASSSGSSGSGGGIYCDSATGIVSNCILTGNGAYYDGGGAYNGTLYNCTLTANSSSNYGGGSSYGKLYNCTLTGNSASYDGGGAYRGTLYNCIVYYNDAGRGANYYYSTFNYSCTTPFSGGLGNIISEPQLASFSHLAAGSPCQGAGHSDYATGTDIDGEVWRTSPSMGCDEVVVGAITGALSVSAWAVPTNVAVGFSIQFRADILGRTTRSVWDFGDGTVLSNNPYARHAYASPGAYAVLLRAYNESYPQGITATVTVHVAAQIIHYVKLDNATPIAPYISWATAATNIQDALDAAGQVGALVLVSNGVYATGGRVVYGAMSNRVAITKPVMVRSVNGPAMTIIQGVGLVGDSAVRCAYVGTNAVLEGFTLTKGATYSSGGGVWCESSGVLSNCALTGNSAFSGGGASGGTLYNCTLTGNSAGFGGGGGVSGGTLYNCMLTGNSAGSGDGGGARDSTLYNCTFIDNSGFSGGGACDSTLYNCILFGNWAQSYGDGGGARDSTLYNCTFTSNSAEHGGGAYGGTLYNCMLTGNSAYEHGGGGGAYESTLYNCIIYYNTASSDSNYRSCTLNYSCTTPDPGGVGNITNDPRFVNAAAGDYHLQSNSPCLNAGTNQNWMIGATDIAGNPRLDAGGRVDMGAYEYQGMSIWPSMTAPSLLDVGSDSAVELGVKFRSDVDGTIAGIRFYKAAANTGAHIGNLWTSDGTLLATATFSNETESGWQQALFATPAAIASNTIYVASYHAENGHYSEDDYYFQGKGVDNPPLHVLANGVSGGNGVYRYGASSLFPNQTWNAANYYVDVVFQAKPVPILMSIAVTPANSNIVIGATQQFTATVTCSDGSAQDITSQATWTSLNPGVATINAGGLATGVSTGTTTISATLAGVVGSTTLTVQAAPLVIMTTSLLIGVSNTVYTATLAASGGTTPYTWSIISGALPSGLTLNTNSGTISGTPTATGTFSFTAQVSDAGSHTANKTLSITITSIPTVVTIWPDTAVPGRVDDGPDNAVELGVKFRSDIAGAITGIRFYKADANTGTHVGNLWTSNGTLLATVIFSNETVSGWQQTLFATPVTITSNTVYVASYHANNGHYSADVNYFEGKGVDNPPLHAPANSVSGGNGVYRYGANSLFPNQSWNAANYWVDVMFQPVQSAPLAITTTSLPNGIMNMAYLATLTADGGALPYTWSIINGTLPAGLTLNSGNGVISGTPTVLGTFSFTVQVSDVGSHTATKALSITITSIPAVVTIWPSNAVPGRIDDGPDKAVELGVKFKSDVAGTITGIRFYKGTANTGVHVGNLWTSNGTRLATVTFSNETASGWQQALFATPVAIASSTVYVASYHAKNGHYSADVNYFEGKGVDNPPLHAPANGVSGGNGVYAYGSSSAFPAQTWNAANYWVDVVFRPGYPPPPAVLTSMTLMAAGGNLEQWPWVWTSGDFSKECGASNLIDGNTNTIWIGNVSGEPWRVILDLGVVTDVTGIQLMFLDIAWTNREIIGSRDSEVWFDYLAETNEWVPLRYLYVNFFGDEHGDQPPAIREIIWRDR